MTEGFPWVVEVKVIFICLITLFQNFSNFLVTVYHYLIGKYYFKK